MQKTVRIINSTKVTICRQHDIKKITIPAISSTTAISIPDTVSPSAPGATSNGIELAICVDVSVWLAALLALIRLI
jgi:hypothetical protein